VTTLAVPRVAAYAAGVQVDTLRKWVRRGHISPPIRGCYDLEEITNWLENHRDQHHAKIAENRYNTPTRHRHAN
jgi:predicted site-specific integrase-resolvase